MKQKVLMGFFNSESNEHSHSLMSFDKFIFKFGDELIDAMHVREIFESNNIDIIPSIYANGHPHGPVTQDAFDMILNRFVVDVKNNINDIDGIFLFLHGASKVLGLEGVSGEHAILKEIRKITGPHLPIAIVMDPHGNISDDLVNNVQILRCFRHSPHIDTKETYEFVAKKLVHLLNNRRNIKPVFYRVPMMMDGERSVSFVEPMKSINKLLDEAEDTGRIMSASYHIGYIRHDDDKLGNGVVVVPQNPGDLEFAKKWAKKIRDYAYGRRKEFEFYGNVEEADEAINKVIHYPGGPCFITDSGDNVGSGADGFNTVLLRKLLNIKDYNNKKYLVAGIVDQNAHKYLSTKKIGENVSFYLGQDIDELSEKIMIEGTLVAEGLGSEEYIDMTEIGTVYTVKLKNHPISVIIEFDSIQYLKPSQFQISGLKIEDYDVIIVKQGYISEEFRTISPLCIMALTKGATNQRTENLTFKRIQRPMYPFDDIELEDM